MIVFVFQNYEIIARILICYIKLICKIYILVL
jgi:hypothetical protein